MVKQGHYAGVSRQTKRKQLKQHHQVKADRTIDSTTVGDFLLVRYHLTQGRQQRPVLRKTMQHFAQQWFRVAQTTSGSTWSEPMITKQTLQQFNRQLPWQGYALINQAMPAWHAFLAKEVPAVPLAERLQLTPLSTADWQGLLSQQLAVNALLGLLGAQQQLAQVTTAQVEQLQVSLISDGQLDWAKIASLLAPITSLAADADAGTQTWFAQLATLTPTDFN